MKTLPDFPVLGQKGNSAWKPSGLWVTSPNPIPWVKVKACDTILVIYNNNKGDNFLLFENGTKLGMVTISIATIFDD